MARFFKNLFSSSSNITHITDEDKKSKEKKEVKESVENAQKEFSAPYDTRRKLSISRSGRTKQNLKVRGKLGGDLYGEIPQKSERTNIEYHVNKNLFDDESMTTDNSRTQSRHRDKDTGELDVINTVECNFKYLDSLDQDNVPGQNEYDGGNLTVIHLKETDF